MIQYPCGEGLHKRCRQYPPARVSHRGYPRSRDGRPHVSGHEHFLAWPYSGRAECDAQRSRAAIDGERDAEKIGKFPFERGDFARRINAAVAEWRPSLEDAHHRLDFLIV